MRPVVAGDEAGGRIDVLAVNHFNRFLQTQYGRHLLSVEGLPKRIGQGEAPSTSATKSFPKIEGERQKKLIEHANLLTVAVPEVDLGKMARTYGMGLLAAPVTGGLSMTVAVGAVGYQAINSIPSASDAATALAMPWPGPLAMDAVWQQLPEAQAPSAQARIAKQVATAINPNWAKLLKLFSTSETEAASAKADLVTDAAWAWGINDGAVAKLAQSFSPTELALLEPSQLKAMSASIKSNLSKTEFEIAQAYIDGNPARAAAVRLEDALVEMRRTGDTAVAAFGVKADQILRAEMENASTSGFVCNAMLQQMTDQMYVEMAARIPEPGQARSEPITGAAAPGAVGTSTHTAATGATAQAYSNPHNTDKGPDVATRHSALQSDANARANVTPNAQSVKDAKLRVLGHVTRDYVQFNTMYSLAFDGGQDDWLAEDIARLSGTKNAYAFQLSDTRRIQGDMIFDTMSADNRTMIEAYIMNGPTSPEYKDAKAASTFNTANQSVFGTSEAEVIAVVQEAGSQQLYEARDLYQRLQAAPNPDPVKVQDARRRMQAAQDAQDRKIMALARNLGGEEEGEALTLEVARTRVSERVNQIAKSFDPSMAGIGEELIREGRMNLAVGANAATSGMGTYDDLLMHVTSSRTRSDLAGFQIDRAALGVGPGNLDFWTETSGDQAQKLEINLMGIPENDRQRMEVANVQTRHDAHDGTGFIANVTMADTWQKEQMLQSHAAMGARARTALDAYIAAHPDEVIPPEIRALTGAQLMPLGGEIHPFVDKLMDADGNLIGAGPTLGMLMSESQVANTAYRSEIARQEAFFTAGITALTIAASVLLLLIPGVNVVAAGILVALVGGAATIAVKAGMRGDRYGWEEAAVDVAKTGIEAAMGGIGGALGGAVKAGTPVLGTIAKVGSKINGAFGKLGGTLGKASAAAVREGITSSVSGVANTALDDRIWSKGTSAGLGELFKAGTRGAVTGALSGGLSEGISQGLTRRMTPGLPEGVDATQLSRLGARLGPAGRDALQEAVSGTAGTLSSETANILFDLSEGKAKFNLADLALRLGKAGFKDFITSGVKAGIKNQFKATYLAQRDRIMRDSAEVSPSDAKFLRKLAISAGMETYGKDTSNPHAKDASARFTSDSAFHQELLASRAAFRNLPPDLQAHAAGMSYQHIAALGQLRETGADGYQGDPKDLSLDLATTYPDMNVKSLLQAVGAGARRGQAGGTSPSDGGTKTPRGAKPYA